MATVPRPAPAGPELPELHSGDRMNREEFHRLYEALFAKDYRRLMTTLEQGLATAEHAAFVQLLASRKGNGEGGR